VIRKSDFDGLSPTSLGPVRQLRKIRTAEFSFFRHILHRIFQEAYNRGGRSSTEPQPPLPASDSPSPSFNYPTTTITTTRIPGAASFYGSGSKKAPPPPDVRLRRPSNFIPPAPPTLDHQRRRDLTTAAGGLRQRPTLTKWPTLTNCRQGPTTADQIDLAEREEWGGGGGTAFFPMKEMQTAKEKEKTEEEQVEKERERDEATNNNKFSVGYVKWLKNYLFIYLLGEKSASSLF
jgi:hypothetical protein